MVRRVLRFPFTQTMLSVYAWAACALAFAILNGYYSVTLGMQVGIAILLGGITTCGMLYLLAEKAFHPITVARAVHDVPRKPALPGVDARVLLAFAVSAGGPLVGAGRARRRGADRGRTSRRQAGADGARARRGRARRRACSR